MGQIYGTHVTADLRSRGFDGLIFIRSANDTYADETAHRFAGANDTLSRSWRTAATTRKYKIDGKNGILEREVIIATQVLLKYVLWSIKEVSRRHAVCKKPRHINDYVMLKDHTCATLLIQGVYWHKTITFVKLYKRTIEYSFVLDSWTFFWRGTMIYSTINLLLHLVVHRVSEFVRRTILCFEACVLLWCIRNGAFPEADFQHHKHTR